MKVDHLLIAGRAELLLPRNEPIRNFVMVQKSKHEALRLFLVRDLAELVPKFLPWNPTLKSPIAEPKVILEDPYAGMTAIEQDHPRLNFDLTLRIMFMKEIPQQFGRKQKFKAALVYARRVLCSDYDVHFRVNMASMKPYFKFQGCKLSDLPRATKV